MNHYYTKRSLLYYGYFFNIRVTKYTYTKQQKRNFLRHAIGIHTISNTVTHFVPTYTHHSTPVTTHLSNIYNSPHYLDGDVNGVVDELGRNLVCAVKGRDAS